MPIYKYQCPECDSFEVFREVNDRNLPCYCPVCGEVSVMQVGAPFLALMTAENRKKWEINEKSKHEPKSVRRSSCGCSGAHTCASTSEGGKKKESSGLQKQTKKNARPWMLGH